MPLASSDCLYATLPAQLFALDDAKVELSAAVPSDGAAAAAAAATPSASARAVSETGAGTNTRSGGSAGQQRLQTTIGKGEMAAILRELPLLVDMAPLGIRVQVVATGADGVVQLSYTGPHKLRRAVEMQLRNALREIDPRMRHVEFVEDVDQS